MAFTEMDQPPGEGKYINIIRKQDEGLAVLALPALAGIARERSYWQRIRQTADPHSLPGGMSSGLIRHLDDLIATGREVEKLVGPQLATAGGKGAHFLSGWYSQAAVIMPYSTFLRSEAAPLMDDPYIDSQDTEQRFFPDYTDDELDKSGVHVADEVIDKIEGLRPQQIGQEVWYEGETIYLRSRKPAEPSIRFTEMFRTQKRRHFDRAGHISLAPRMKTAAWMGSSQ